MGFVCQSVCPLFSHFPHADSHSHIALLSPLLLSALYKVKFVNSLEFTIILMHLLAVCLSVSPPSAHFPCADSHIYNVSLSPHCWVHCTRSSLSTDLNPLLYSWICCLSVRPLHASRVLFWTFHLICCLLRCSHFSCMDFNTLFSVCNTAHFLCADLNILLHLLSVCHATHLPFAHLHSHTVQLSITADCLVLGQVR